MKKYDFALLINDLIIRVLEILISILLTCSTTFLTWIICIILDKNFIYNPKTDYIIITALVFLINFCFAIIVLTNDKFRMIIDFKFPDCKTWLLNKLKKYEI